MMTVATNIVLLGSSSEIGAALLRRAGEVPAAMILAVSRSEPVERLASSNIEYLTGIDLADPASLDRLRDAVSSKFSGPFSVIHSVGDFWVHRALVDTSFETIQSMVSSHVLTLFGAARWLTPLMQERGGGKLVAFSCNSVGYNYPDMSPFTASKAAVETFIKCYANEHAEFGISACALALPTILTETIVQEKPHGDHANYITPEQLAEIVIGQILPQSPEINGTVVKLFKHSPTFYHSSYYARNPRVQENRAGSTVDDEGAA